MSGDHNQYQKGCDHSWHYIGSKRQAAWQCSHCGRLALDNPNHTGRQMISAQKLQYYTMAHRLRGYASGLDEYKHDALIGMLNTAASLLEHAWDEYQATLPPEQQIGS